MRKFKMNKKGASPAFAWIFGLISLFGIGVMFIVFSQVFSGYLVPIIKNQANASVQAGQMDLATQSQVNGGIDKYMTYFNLLPFILFFVIVIYMFVVSLRKEGVDEY